MSKGQQGPRVPARKTQTDTSLLGSCSSLDTRFNFVAQIINGIKTFEPTRLEICKTLLEFSIKFGCQIMLALKRFESRLNDFGRITVQARAHLRFDQFLELPG
jgi:hypothetical protein